MPPAPPGVAADRIPLRARSIINGIRSIGAIGVSGVQSSQDEQIAQAGVAALG